jgi:hypothetical protein
MDELFKEPNPEFSPTDFCDGRVEMEGVYDYRMHIDSNGFIVIFIKRLGSYAERTIIFKSFDEFKESKIGSEIFEFRKSIISKIIYRLEENNIEVNIENAYYYLDTLRLNSSRKSAHVRK